jgi:hypothetical protein
MYNFRFSQRYNTVQSVESQPTLKMEVICSSETLVTSNKLHGITPHNIVHFSNTVWKDATEHHSNIYWNKYFPAQKLSYSEEAVCLYKKQHIFMKAKTFLLL